MLWNPFNLLTKVVSGSKFDPDNSCITVILRYILSFCVMDVLSEILLGKSALVNPWVETFILMFATKFLKMYL